MIGSLFTKTACLKFSAILFFALFLVQPVHAQAQQPASSPQVTCITQTGEKIATYAEGIHGIVGDFRTFTGRDEVFALGNEDALQCFCATDGSGVETIWWSSFPEDSVDELTASGWIFVPNGFLWGLAAKPYLAKNTNYTCSSSVQGGTVQSTSDSTSGDVLGISTLSATGNFASRILMILGLILMGAGVWRLLHVPAKRKAQ